MDARPRIGFVGVGSMGQMAHLRNYAVLPCEIVALAELREQTGAAVAERYRIPRCYRSAAQMLEHEKLDALVASQPFTRHGVVLEELLAAGIPVLIEKPIAASVDIARRIAETVERSGTFVMVGYHKRSDPATMYAKQRIDELVSSGELGRMTYVRILMPAGDWVAHGFDELLNEGDPAPQLASDPPDPDLDERGREQYISFVNYYIHQVNLLRHLIGSPYRPVFADRAGKLLVAEADNGVTGTIEMSPYQTTIDWQEQALVCFERGWIRLDLPAPLAHNRAGRVTVYRDPGGGALPVEESPTLPWTHAMRQQAANFLAAVRGERAPLTGASEALEDLVVAREYLRLYTGA